MKKMADSSKTLKLDDIPVMNFGRFMLDKMAPFKENEAMVEGETGKSCTYNDIITRSERLAAGLQGLGVQKDDVVCIFAPNHLDYPVVYYATALNAAVLQTVNPLFTTDDLHKVLADYGTKFLFTVPALAPKVQTALKGLEHIQVIVFGEADGCLSLENVLAEEGTPYSIPDADWKSTTAVLLSSSGTTGFPKAIKMSHFALIANVLQMLAAGVSAETECLILFLPMFHIYGLSAVVAAGSSQGKKIVIMARFNPEEYLRLIQTYRPHTLHVVPPVMVMFAKHPKVSEYDLSSVKSIICGAAPLSGEIEEAVKIRMNLETIHQGFGMTETGITHVNKGSDCRYKAVGKVMDLVEQKIVDPDTGLTLGPNEEGEVWIRGPQAASGFLNLPEQTKEMFVEDGWIRTGDIGKEDEDGFLYIVDRLKELIKYKGYQVAPASLEDILLRHEAVADVGVIGVPDEEGGELPKAYVVRKAGKEVTETELQDFVAGAVAPYMKLRGGVEFVTEIPRSASGKILRRTLRQRLLATQ